MLEPRAAILLLGLTLLVQILQGRKKGGKR